MGEINYMKNNMSKERTLHDLINAIYTHYLNCTKILEWQWPHQETCKPAGQFITRAVRECIPPPSHVGFF